MVDDGAGPGETEEKQHEEPEHLQQEWSDDVRGLPSCPPADAVPTGGTVYRRQSGDRHQTYKEQNKCRKGAGHEEQCRCASISVFSDIESLRDAAKVHVYMAAQPILRADLSKEHGVIARTGTTPGHCSLWLRRKYLAIRDRLFEPVP
jgi:hypothetical protein